MHFEKIIGFGASKCPTQIARWLVSLAAFLLAVSPARAQVTSWTEIVSGGGGYPEPGALNAAGPILGTALPSYTPTEAPAWVGAQSTMPANLGPQIFNGTDGAGNDYVIYVELPVGGADPLGWVSMTPPGGAALYFRLGFIPVSGAVTPTGYVFIMERGAYGGGDIYLLNPDGTITDAIPRPFSYYTNPSTFTLDAYENVVLENWIPVAGVGGGEPITETFAATGPIPYFSGPIQSAANYAPLASFVPSLDPNLYVPFAPPATLSLSAGEATSTIPITYQWSYSGSPIVGATQADYEGPYLGDGVYSVAASTAEGTVTANANVTLVIDGEAASPTPLIDQVPDPRSFTEGSTATLTATFVSTQPITCQWYLNGIAIAGATDSEPSSTVAGLYTTTFVASQPGTYSVQAVTPGPTGGTINIEGIIVTELDASGHPIIDIPVILTGPTSGAFTYGTIPELTVQAEATLPVTYQWMLDGVSIPGATQATLSTAGVGTYTVVVATSVGSITSQPAVLTLASHPVDISTRAGVGTGANACVAGFSISSFSGATKRLLIRGVGPSLSQFNVEGVLGEPVLTVFDALGNVVAANTGWGDAASISAAALSSGAFPLMAGSSDSALVLDLAPGNYTAQVTGANGTTGIALVEVYELAADSGHLVNLSTRANAGSGAAALIGGFVVGGTQDAEFLIRAIGPGLVQFGVPGTLADPVLSVYDSGGNLVAVNVGWSNGSSEDAVSAANAASASGAFALQPGSADCAIAIILAPGSYTAEVTGVDGSTGVALVEVYQVPQSGSGPVF